MLRAHHGGTISEGLTKMAKILVVDDDPDLLALVVRRLGHAGHRVQSALAGREALALIEERGAPDIVVLDVNMPDLDGLGLLVAVREQTGRADLPAIFLSGRVEAGDVAAGRALGAVYLTKPFVSSALLAAIESQLAKIEVAVPDAW
jgi:DNA-binding response OmpR family regulator